MKHYTFTELKAYFENAKLPKKMASNHIYYTDVKKTVNLYINRIENEIIKHGAKVGKSTTANTTKAQLLEMKNVLEDKNNHFEW